MLNYLTASVFLCLFGLEKDGTTALDPGDDGEEKNAQRASWGVCTELPFEGFVQFLTLCE